MAVAIRARAKNDVVSLPPAARIAVDVMAVLVASGVRHVVTCPGSRNAPLLYAAAAAEASGLLTLHPRSDERSAAFLALGLSLGDDRRPVAIITTSGTAVGNLHPAIMEAAHSGVPVIAVTADRPAGLHGVGANQVADQRGVFTPSAVTTSIAADAGVGSVLDACVTALAAASTPGDMRPAHLNVELADPLTPPVSGHGAVVADPLRTLSEALGQTLLAARQRRSRDVRGRGAVGDAPSSDRTPEVDWLPEVDRILEVDRTLVIAGAGADPRTADLCRAAPWPLIAEVVAGIGGRAPTVAAYRDVLDLVSAASPADRPGTGARWLPALAEIEQIVVIGRPTLSRQVPRLIQDSGARVISIGQFDGGVDRYADPGRRAAVRLNRIPADWCDFVPGTQASDVRSRWLAGWLAAGRAAESAPRARADTLANVSLAWGARSAVARVLAVSEDEDTLVLGPSGVVRRADELGLTSRTRVVSNRGLSGIDGVVATAIGVAGTNRRGRVRALVGDLTFLHDLGALQTGHANERPDLQIIVINDGGGTIFGHLEHGEVARSHPSARDAVTRLLTTPASASLPDLCRGLNVPHVTACSAAELDAILRLPGGGISVVEVPVTAETTDQHSETS